jgi:hypothetical protein
MKRMAMAATAATLLGMGSAHAQMSMPPASAFYGELGYTFFKVDALGDTARPGGIRGIIGWEAHPFFAVEGMLGGGVTDDDTTATVNGIPANLNVENKSYYGIFLKPKYSWQQAEFFARLGYAHTKFEVESRTAGVASRTQSNDDFAWGLGANFRFSRFFYVGADWMRYANQSGEKVDGLTLSVGYHW